MLNLISKEKKLNPWAAQIKELAKYPNVYCKLSGIITEADHQNWKTEDIFPYLDIVFDAFGPNRLTFGSDWPVCLLAGTYNQVVNMMDEYLKNESEEVKENIFYKNVLSFYSLNIN